MPRSARPAPGTPSARRFAAATSRDAYLDLVVVDVVRVLVAARLGLLLERDGDSLDAVALHLEDVEAHPVVRDVVARLRRAAELAEDETGDRMEVLVGQVGAEPRVELVDREHPVDAVLVVGDLLDRLLGHVELVLDLADDLLEQILERRDPDHRAVLVDDHGEVAVRAPELLQERREILRLGDHVRRAQQRREIEARPALGRESP